MATVFTTAGKQWSVDKWDESVSTKPEYIGWGTGAGTAAVGDTTLFTEASEARVGPAGSGVTLSQPSADTLQITGTMTAGGSKTITNAGVFTASTAGTLILKADFTGIPLLAGDSIAFTWTLQQT